MEIAFIAEKVKNNVRGDRFVLADETVGVHHITSLFYGHMKDAASFELGGFSYVLDKDILTMSGTGTFPDHTPCSLEMIFFNDENGTLQVEMPRQYLLPAFSDMPLSCRCTYEEEIWKITFRCNDAVSIARLLAGGISYLGIPVPYQCFGDIGNVFHMRFEFELPFVETAGEQYWKKYLSLYFETDLQLDLSGIFKNGNQVGLGLRSFLLEKFEDEYGFSFEGDLKIWEFELPFVIRYDRNALMLSTIKDEKTTLAIPSVNDLGKIVGLDDLHLPESFSALTNFECEMISLSVSADFSHLLSFTVVISNKNIWQITQTPDIHITNLRAGFTKDSLRNEVFISGDLDIADWKLTLSARYDTQAGWVFRGHINGNGREQLNLSGLFGVLCKFLGFKEIPFPLPDLDIVGAMAAYSLQTKQFSVQMDIGRLVCDFQYLFQPSKSYLLHLKTDFEFSLSEIPVVGTDLHLLDHMSVRDIHLDAAPGNVTLNLNFAGEPLRLQLGGGQEKNLIPEDSGYGLSNAEKEAMKIFWFPLEKHFSIFTIHRLGLGFGGRRLTFALDAELATGAFRLSLEGLSMSLELSEKPSPSFDLSGLCIGFQNPNLTISGGFMHSVCGGISSYDGTLLVKTKKISVFIAGSYSKGSFLAYGMLKAKIGGPPAFSVTGIAIGFGYQKYLMLPGIAEVEKYPLVAAAVDPDFSAAQLLEGIKNKTVTSPGQNFLAAGVSFHSFGMASSFALLTVSFGQHLEIALLGISELTAPPMTKTNPIAKAKLALKAALLPEAGVFSVQAQLMPDSYILSKDCRLTGGFAFFLWFDGEHKGDFVITLGGYRKGYQKPAHYPEVPRLGFKWNVTSELTLSGEMYFALTPSALCAGGKLEAVFVKGALKAWFTAYADFEIGWKPFYYDISIGVSLGASITLDFRLFSKTFVLEMSVDLHIWGPEFSGRAKIKWWVISFTISFGAGGSYTDTIDWNEFKSTFLQSQAAAKRAGKNAKQDGILSIHAAEGVIGKITENGREIEVLCADMAKLDVESLIPCLSVSTNGKKAAKTGADDTKIGVLPMGENVVLASDLDITITADAGNGEIVYQTEEIRRNVPKALWARQKTKKNGAGGASAGELIGNVLSGVYIVPSPKEFPLFPAEKFLTLDLLSEYEKTKKNFCFIPTVLMPDITGRDADFAVLKKTAGRIHEKVSAFAREMASFGFIFDFTPDLTIMSEKAEDLFDEEFMLSRGMGRQKGEI